MKVAGLAGEEGRQGRRAWGPGWTGAPTQGPRGLLQYSDLIQTTPSLSSLKSCTTSSPAETVLTHTEASLTHSVGSYPH